jgi:hypothetical protein
MAGSVFLILFVAVWLAGIAELVLGIVHGRADYIVMGIFIGLSMLWIVRTTWRNLRLALTDYREVKGGGSLR